MDILISSIVDLKRTPPSRLHNFIAFLSTKHDITVLCINDCWKSKSSNVEKYYQNFREIYDSIKIDYITAKKIPPWSQEISCPIYIDYSQYKYSEILLNYNTLFSGYYAAKKLNIPMVYDLADDLTDMIANSPQIPRLLRPMGRIVGNNLIARNLNLSKSITCISTALKETYCIPDGKYQYVPNGVNTRLFKKINSEIKENLKMGDSIVLGYVGVLREWVNLKPIYQVLREMPNIKLLIVGEEGLIAANKLLVHNYGIENRVIFAGTVSYKDIPSYISAMDICLIPFNHSLTARNAVPLKLFEYMACEKPIISTPLNGIIEVVGNRIYYANSKEDYKKCIKSILNESTGSNIYIRNRDFVEKNYDWNVVSHKLEKAMYNCL